MDTDKILRKIAVSLSPVVTGLASAYAPYSRKLISASDYRESRKIIRPGDVLVTKTRGEFANLLIPGEYSHAGVYAGEDKVFEAVSSGVKQTDILEFMMKKDHISVQRPIFLSEGQIIEALLICEEDILGLPYDWDFAPNNKAYFCTEMIWHIFKKASESQGEIFRRREILGVETVIPDDFVLAESKFKQVFCVNPLF